MNLALDIVFLLVGFTLLAKGSNWLVTGSTVIADRLGVRPLIIGLTVVAWGTSAPEVVVGAAAAVEGKPDMTLGTVLGSNVANIALVLGSCALILPKVLHNGLGWRESFWVLVSLGLFWWVCADLEMTRLDAGLLLGVFAIYNLQLFLEARRMSRGAKREDPPTDTWFQRHPKWTVLLGAVAITIAAKGVIDGASGIAEAAGVSRTVISLTAVALGTSLPELAAGVSGAFKGHSDISLGNVVGSNVFNVMAVVGIAGLVRPFGGSGEPRFQTEIQRYLDLHFPVAMGFTLAIIVLPLLGGERGGRAKGLVLLLAYGAYVWVLFTRGELPEA